MVDLAVSDFIIVERSASPGDNVTVVFEARNDFSGTDNGDATDFWIDIYLSDNDFISDLDEELHFEFESLLEGAKTKSYSIEVQLPFSGSSIWGSDDTYYIGTIIDATSNVSETEEGNNSNRGFGLDKEGIFIEINPPADPLAQMRDAVYRFYNQFSGRHFYTAVPEERDLLTGARQDWGFVGEGVAFNVSRNPGSNLQPIYRMFNSNTGSHFYTVDEAERDLVLANPSWGYIDEGIAFYALDKDASIGTDVHRYFRQSTQSHFFTIGAQDIEDIANIPELANDFIYEGVAFEVNTF